MRNNTYNKLTHASFILAMFATTLLCITNPTIYIHTAIACFFMTNFILHFIYVFVFIICRKNNRDMLPIQSTLQLV